MKEIVYKRRERMILSEAVPYLAGKSEPGFDSQILHEITWFRNYYRGLAPAMYIAYDRIACFGTEDRNFRVTSTPISDGVPTICVLTVQRKEPGFLEPGWYLMEVKSPGAVPYGSAKFWMILQSIRHHFLNTALPIRSKIRKYQKKKLSYHSQISGKPYQKTAFR